MTVGASSGHWLAGQAHLKPSTRERYAGIVKGHIKPRWAEVRLVDVSQAAIQTWITELAKDLEPATARKVHRVLSLILTLAVRDGRLAKNPADRVNLPRVAQAERRYLSHEQVAALADSCARPTTVSKHRRRTEREKEMYRLIVLFLAYTGVRFGELAALRVRRLDLVRGRATIAESVTLVNATQVWGTPRDMSGVMCPSQSSCLRTLPRT